jgi:two-component system chemotaxis sensor kinase CheA
MDEMLQEFVAEALDLSTEVEEQLLALEKAPGNLEILNAVFRAFHTIKGGAGFMNLSAMVTACHLTENLFDALRNGQASVTPAAIEAALLASSFVGDQLTALSTGTPIEQLASMPEDLSDLLTAAIEGSVVEETTVHDSESAARVPESDSLADADNADGIPWGAYYQAILDMAREVSNVEADEIEVPAAPNLILSRSELPSARTFAIADEPADVSVGSHKEETLRVKAQKLDELLEVAGESVQAANQASALLEKLLPFKQEEAAAQLMAALSETLSRASRYTTELQRATLATRMQPVGRLFQRFPRLVRELAKDMDKQVELVIEGAETEVDRVVVDSLYDPLVHMLRNSLDHGIESSAQRLAAGKAPKAKVTLRAWQEASSVVIEVADDGAGIDASRLQAKAVASGMIGADENLSHHDALQLIFRPGLSIKDQATSVSGRGVGMDVVKTTVEKHRGSIQIESVVGAGTIFSIRLPIELSIVPTMLVSAGEVLLGMPMSAVERVIELPDEFMGVGGAPMFTDQGRHLPVRSLAGVLGYTPKEERLGLVVACAHPYILSVRAVEGTADLVIKPMTAMPARGIAGTARSAEGSLVLVLDVAFLISGASTA